MSVVEFSSIVTAGGQQIGIATLNVEATLNALSMEMVQLLDAQLKIWETDPAIALVFLQGAGEKAFCAGGDLHNLYSSMLQHHNSDLRDDMLGNHYALSFFSQEYRLDYHIHTYRKPIVCWGHGIVMGGGIGLMAGASHRVVTEKSRLAMPEIGIGLFPDVGGTWFLNRMPGKLGLFLALTGASINASDAQFIGLADVQLPHASKEALLAKLKSMVWGGDAKENHARLNVTLEAMSTVQEPGPLRQHFELINRLCEEEDLQQIVERISALAYDDNQDIWLRKAASNLKKGSPTSIWLAYQLLKRGQHLSLAEVFRMELIAVLACATENDFTEGIRALLIEKDLRPQWQPESIADIAGDYAAVFFDSPWSEQDHPLFNLEHSS